MKKIDLKKVLLWVGMLCISITTMSITQAQTYDPLAVQRINDFSKRRLFPAHRQQNSKICKTIKIKEL